MREVIVIGGPTASGKTRLAIHLARQHHTEVVSADSRQFYREMRIGNARPSPEELATVPHHFIADRSIHTPLSAGRYAEEALGVIEQLHRQHPTVVVVGGSGLYIRALCEGLHEFPEISQGARSRVQKLSQTQGLAGLQAEVGRLDSAYYATVDRQNSRRLERALRVMYSGDGRPYSDYLNQPKPPRPFTVRYLRLDVDRSELYQRIDRRVVDMVRDGLETEARALYSYRELPVMQTVGYREWWPYFAGEYDRARVIELIQRNSRRYAKRQMTWFRDYPTHRDTGAAAR